MWYNIRKVSCISGKSTPRNGTYVANQALVMAHLNAQKNMICTVASVGLSNLAGWDWILRLKKMLKKKVGWRRRLAEGGGWGRGQGSTWRCRRRLRLRLAFELEEDEEDAEEESWGGGAGRIFMDLLRLILLRPLQWTSPTNRIEVTGIEHAEVNEGRQWGSTTKSNCQYGND